MNKKTIGIKKNKGYTVKEAYTIDQLINENYVSSKFNFSYQLNSEKKNLAIKLLENYKLNKKTIKWTLSSKTIFFEGKINDSEVLIYVESPNKTDKATILIFTETLDNMSLIYNELFDKTVKDFLSESDVAIKITEFSFSGNQIIEDQLTLKKETFKELSQDYYPYIKMNTLVKEFITRQENILVLTGPTGVGKTKFSSLILKHAIKYYDLLENVNKTISKEDYDDYFEDFKEIKVAYIKNEDILSSDSFWSIIKSRQFDFIILDDLDYMLLPRTREVNSEVDIKRSKFISQLLSYTDGIIQNTTKFIITSNKSSKDIDSALLRPGRMFSVLEFRNLKYKEALNLVKKQLKNNKKKIKIFKKTFKDKKLINPSEIGSFIYQFKFKERKEDFLLEEEISLEKDLNNLSSKDIGF